jgi:hypothetical protein
VVCTIGSQWDIYHHASAGIVVVSLGFNSREGEIELSLSFWRNAGFTVNGKRRLLPSPVGLYPQPVARPSIFIVPSKLRARIVNYNDPVTIVKDAGAYAFPSGFRDKQLDLLMGRLNRWGHEALAAHGMTRMVYLCETPCPTTLA